MIGTTAALALGGGALLGGLAGAIPKSSSTTTTVNAGKATASENMGLAGRDSAFGQLQGLTAAGPGMGDVTAATNSSRDFANLLSQYSQNGGMPSTNDISTANGFASSIFAPQQTALNQSFVTQNTDAQRLAAQLGRPVDDPIIQAKLRTNMMNNQAMLTSQQGAYGANLALQMPGQRVQYAGQAANTLGNLATQAFQNRAALLSAGSDIVGAERNFRVQTATRTGDTTSGGGLGGAISGALGGAGAGASALSLFGAGGAGSMFGGASTAAASSAPATLDFSQSLSPQIAGAGAPGSVGFNGFGSSGSTMGGGATFGGFSPKSYSLGGF